jgi:NADP-dependent 3-hydroxy acid dehydrogenase YdfG
MESKLADKKFALVMGGSSHLGAAIVHALADAGLQVLASGRDSNRLAQVSGGRNTIQTIAADITTAAGLAAVQALVTERGRLDVLVLGSGIYERSSNPDVLMRQFASNVLAPYTLLQTLRPLLVAAKGLVVFLNSTQGRSASGGVGQYAATQHAMRAIADSLREEVNSLGVAVTSIYLGRTATARQAAIYAMEHRSYAPEQLIQPEDVASIVTNLVLLPRTAEVTEVVMRPRSKPT